MTGPPSDPGSVHVHDLDDLSEKLAKGAWKGVVNVAVRDTTEDSVTGFTVTSATVDGYTYDNSSNHDPDGDSDGTSIQLSK